LCVVDEADVYKRSKLGSPLQVNLKLFQSAPGKHKTVLLIVIRDRTRTPQDKMFADMRTDLETIWASLVKPPEYEDCPVDDFFQLQFVSLPSYEIEQDDFLAEATLLRRRFLPSHDTSIIRTDPTKARPFITCQFLPLSSCRMPSAACPLACPTEFL
jgi:hypothetical protein